MADDRPTLVTKVTVAVAAVGGAVVLAAVAAAIWTSTAGIWLKVVGSFVAFLFVTGFVIRLWLISHPYGSLPRHRRG